MDLDFTDIRLGSGKWEVSPDIVDRVLSSIWKKIMEKRYYSQFWFRYCTGDLQLDPEFARRDDDYFEESLYEDYTISGRVRFDRDRQYVEYKDFMISDIEGKQI